MSQGYGIRLAVESKSKGWNPLEKLARVWQPSRLKGIQVGKEYGTPFLAAGQVYEVRPVIRKWLSLERTPDEADRFVSEGTILVTCSGNVGRTTLAFNPHLKTLITHDLLRIEPQAEPSRGWIYAYLRAPKVRAMMKSARYGHIIKHLEVSHLNALPFLDVNEKWLEHFQDRLREIIILRNKAYAELLEAEAYFEQCVGPIEVKDIGENGFAVNAKAALFNGRRRLDALIHNPRAAKVRRHLKRQRRKCISLSDAGYRAWLPTRFRRVPAQDGIALLDSSDLFEINPDVEKWIADGDFGDTHRGRVEPGWLLLARSGQIYGLIGSLTLASHFHKDKIISDHIIRIAPAQKPQIRPGYLLVALSHPTLGRPIIKSLPYGSSVPEIEVLDVQELEIVRLDEKQEEHIANLAEHSAELRANADIIETTIATEAEDILERFICGNNTDIAKNLS